MYLTHSMRRGGASELRQRGLPEDVIAQHGGWKSRSSMLKYFDGSVELLQSYAICFKVGCVWQGLCIVTGAQSIYDFLGTCVSPL